MKVLLVDVDSHIPNLALMKLSSFYKAKGAEITLIRYKLMAHPHHRKIRVNNLDADLTFVSIIFTVNKDRISFDKQEGVQLGGSGYDLTKQLPKEIENTEPDYSIYPEFNYSIGFLSRGCIRKCQFCIVPQKEGPIHQVTSPQAIIKHELVLFLDNNFLALSNHYDLLKDIIKTGAKFQFNQGLDIRLLDEPTADLLAKARTYREIIFAYDDLKLKNSIEPKIINFATKVAPWKIKLFIYCHPKHDIKNDVLYRIEFCRRNKILPYLMRDAACYSDKNNHFYVDLAAYINQVYTFKTMSFSEFLKRRHPKNTDRIQRSLQIYQGSK